MEIEDKVVAKLCLNDGDACVTGHMIFGSHAVLPPVTLRRVSIESDICFLDDNNDDSNERIHRTCICKLSMFYLIDLSSKKCSTQRAFEAPISFDFSFLSQHGLSILTHLY